VARIVGGLEDYNLDLVNLTKPGWVADENSCKELGLKLSTHKVGPEDVIVIDPISNDTYCGTDQKGNHADPIKIGNKWHIRGQLSVRA
jgi:hypothetical protein